MVIHGKTNKTGLFTQLKTKKSVIFNYTLEVLQCLEPKRPGVNQAFSSSLPAWDLAAAIAYVMSIPTNSSELQGTRNFSDQS